MTSRLDFGDGSAHPILSIEDVLDNASGMDYVFLATWCIISVSSLSQSCWSQSADLPPMGRYSTLSPCWKPAMMSKEKKQKFGIWFVGLRGKVRVL